jgi:hypothetical protein
MDKINQSVKGPMMVELSQMYTENGDAISNQYGGSNAMHSAELS